MSAQLVWPIKSSFRRYIQGLADGAVAAQDGAVIEPETFCFPIASQIDFGCELPQSVAASGEVRFGGHYGMLVVPFRNPGLLLTEGGGHQLSIEYPWASPTPEPRLVIATVMWEGWTSSSTGMRELKSRKVELTADGAELFNGTYAPGDELDPLKLAQFSDSGGEAKA